MSLEEALEKRDELDEDFGSDLADASPQERKQALEADEKREQAKQAFLDALEKNPSLMMTTAGSSFEGWRVTEYRGTLSTDAVVGAGLPAEADAIVSDLTDQRSLLLGSKMERAKRIAWNELLFRAHEAGANGILAIRYDVYMLPKGLFGASVTGTAVAIEQLSQLNQALSQDLFGAIGHQYRREGRRRHGQPSKTLLRDSGRFASGGPDGAACRTRRGSAFSFPPSARPAR